ncbi:hypothetical protein K450DRAFT_230737 [Umbelopsis ramanniana AG]|uniref:ATP-dependent DNA helicase n=1 Tax=Umbelopsis ramanniana AG TaxID=1314678 RepID=A0AAD5EEF5_UMBRA|nr:uncharacterized protein K450DRAFT_230737 [Umbelopsis ramanniana AG]KAI8581689.1 hypothetical protein K450DRAFT_230737 [Umbelopsis ramanniana AG]
MSQGRGSRPGQNSLKRESSILSYFSKKDSNTTATTFVSAKNLTQSQPISNSSPTVPLTTRHNSHPFAASRSATKQITNDSKYVDAELYGDQKLVFSSQITAKRSNTTLAAPKVAAPKQAQDHAVFEDLIDLTMEVTETVPKPRIASFANRQASKPSVGLASAGRAWNAVPTNISSSSSMHTSTANTFEFSHGGPSAMDVQPFKVAAGSSNSSQTESSSMFGNPAFSAATTQSKKRVLPSKSFSDAKRGRVSDGSLSSSQGATREITRLGQYKLSDEQNAVLEMALYERKSLFFTGSAGTGKSILLREIIAQMQRKYGSGIAITASTGIAACNIGGLTLHSFAGIGLGHDSVEKLVKRISTVKQIYRRWTTISVLVIDESKCCIIKKCYERSEVS